MNLRAVFSAVAVKRLASVDLPTGDSHQHEINGVSALRQFFGSADDQAGEIDWHFFSDDVLPEHARGRYRFYDARAESFARTGRSEWRLYYSDRFLERANPGDVLVLVRTVQCVVHALVLPAGSAWLRSVSVLLGLEGLTTTLWAVPDESLAAHHLEFAERQILSELEIEAEPPVQPGDEAIAEHALEAAKAKGLPFPTTARMSALARDLVKGDTSDGDAVLVAWLDREERLFRAIERIIVQVRLDQNFTSVDEFVTYSLSVQNRRKSRMGFALQHHLSALFTARGLRFSTQATTEGKNKPDFLFPGMEQYHDPVFDANHLAMLAAKSSCKDRWRQVLTEANRIPQKHLCTLERAISVDQTDEMRIHGVTLIVPGKLHDTFTEHQRSLIWSVEDFVSFVQSRQQS